MEILSKEEFLQHSEKYKKKIRSGSVFIYPTDTIYGIGCNALDDASVNRIREIKKRPTLPFSIIAPGKKWIIENCMLNKDAEKWLDKLPGPYTFVVNLKNEKAISGSVKPSLETIGVRIPDNWFSAFISETGLPVVTTSVNIHGEPYMTSLEDLDAGIKSKVDFIIYDGVKTGKPSTLVIFNKNNTEIKERLK